jgi:hypothetical protein
MDSNFDPSRYTVSITDERDEESPTFRLSELDKLREATGDSVWYSIESDCPNLADLLEYLSPRCDQFAEEPTINGVPCAIAVGPEHTLWLVPVDKGDVIASSHYYWEPPATSVGLSFFQRVALRKLDDLYWVDCAGDIEPGRIYVGRFPSVEAALPALVEASPFHYFDDEGTLRCEVDDFEDDDDDEVDDEGDEGDEEGDEGDEVESE